MTLVESFVILQWMNEPTIPEIPAGPLLMAEVQRCRTEYANALEAIHHQHLVIAKLESILRERLVPCQLRRDASTLTTLSEGRTAHKASSTMS